MEGIDWIYIVHYKPLTERKEYLSRKFSEYGITNYTFFEEYDRNTTPREVMNSYFKLNNLTPAQICITIAHIEIYRLMIEKGHRSILILEDDAIFGDSFIDKFNTYMSCAPADYEMLFLNDGCQQHAAGITPDKIWYNGPHTRTCCAYVITRAACEKLLPTIIPFTKAIDHELNKQMIDHSLIVYWCEPTIITDGSGIKYPASYRYF